MRPLLLRAIKRVAAFFSTAQPKEILTLKVVVIISLYLAVIAVGRFIAGPSPEYIDTSGAIRSAGCIS